MPSTGSASITLTRDGLITSSLQALRVLQEGQVANATQIADAAMPLNMLIANWQSNGLQLWTYQLLPIPCVANKYVYTIGPSGADITSTRPLRLMDDGSFIRNNINPATPVDTPLIILSRTDYNNMGSKTSQGVVNSLYYQPGIDVAGGVTSPSTGYGTLNVYVNPLNTSYTIYGNFQRPIYTMSGASDEFDFPTEWFLALRYGLAEILADDYEVPDNRLMRIAAQAKRYHDGVQDWSVEQAKFRFQPDNRMGARWP